MAITVKTLKGGHLAELMAARMLEEDQLRKRFAKKCEKPAPKVLAAYEKMYGWHPAAELAEWQGVVDAYLDVRDAVSDVWMIGGSLEYAASKKKPTLEKLMTDHDGLITLFTGFEMFGMDPSGDRCFVSTLRHPLEVAEVIALAKKVPGEITAALAGTVAKNKIGKLKPKKLDELRQAVRKNADEKLLEPAAREATTKERSAGIKKADKKDVIARLKKGEDGWALIREFPDDVDAHDAILEAMAKGDKAFAKKLERYMQQRAEDDIYDVWPKGWSMDTFDPRLSPAIGAAFRAGLKFDADHKRASSSLVNTLAHLDDDVAMDAFAAAIEACRMDDDRLETGIAPGSKKNDVPALARNRVARFSHKAHKACRGGRGGPEWTIEASLHAVDTVAR